MRAPVPKEIGGPSRYNLILITYKLQSGVQRLALDFMVKVMTPYPSSRHERVYQPKAYKMRKLVAFKEGPCSNIVYMIRIFLSLLQRMLYPSNKVKVS